MLVQDDFDDDDDESTRENMRAQMTLIDRKLEASEPEEAVRDSGSIGSGNSNDSAAEVLVAHWSTSIFSSDHSCCACVICTVCV